MKVGNVSNAEAIDVWFRGQFLEIKGEKMTNGQAIAGRLLHKTARSKV